MIGIYNGYYRYNNSRVRKSLGYDKTFFKIVIDFSSGSEFSGTVLDDVESAGMKELGQIRGKLEDGRISFEKYMPRHYTLDLTNNRQEEHNDIHPTIMYYGKTAGEHKFEGNWKIPTSYKILWGRISLKTNIGSGTWKMQKEN